MSARRHLAVLGSPIAHSKSPALHAAAYGALGLPWDYEAIEVGSGGLEPFLRSLDDSWRGLSLTMPLKREVLGLLDELDAVGETVGAANTVLFDAGRARGFNTDVHGITAALREAGIGLAEVEPLRTVPPVPPVPLRTVQLLGSGATAASVLVAINGLGASRVHVSTRSPAKAGELRELALRLGLDTAVDTFDAKLDAVDPVTDLVICTLPGDAPLVREFPAEFRSRVPLVEVAYDPWPTPLAQHWLEAGGRVYSGLGMLLHQALAQVRVFVGGHPDTALDDEQKVLAAMRAALGPTPIVG